MSTSDTQETVIGCIDLYPKSGKLEFVKHSPYTSDFLGHGRFKYHKDSERRGSVTQIKFQGLDILRDGQSHNIKIIHMENFCVHDTSDHNSTVALEYFINGLPESLSIVPDCTGPYDVEQQIVTVDSSMSLDHLILAVNARLLFTGISYWQSFLWSAKPTNIEVLELQNVSDTFHLAAKHLADRYKKVKPDHDSSCHVDLIITHMDMVAHYDKSEARDIIRNRLECFGVPENSIFFTEKECTWDNEDLQEQEDCVLECFQHAADHGGHYFDYLNINDSSHGCMEIDLHVADDECTHEHLGHIHRFTEDTIDKTFNAIWRRALAVQKNFVYCAVCDQDISELCAMCTKAMQDSDRSINCFQKDCITVVGECGHRAHFHCITKYLRTHNNQCPEDGESWEFDKVISV